MVAVVVDAAIVAVEPICIDSVLLLVLAPVLVLVLVLVLEIRIQLVEISLETDFHLNPTKVRPPSALLKFPRNSLGVLVLVVCPYFLLVCP